MDKIVKSLNTALSDCLIATVGDGQMEYNIDGNLLYERIKGIVNMIPDNTSFIDIFEELDKVNKQLDIHAADNLMYTQYTNIRDRLINELKLKMK